MIDGLLYLGIFILGMVLGFVISKILYTRIMYSGEMLVDSDNKRDIKFRLVLESDIEHVEHCKYLVFKVKKETLT